MPSINTPESGHAGPAGRGGWQWLPYTDPDALLTLKRAIGIIDARIRGYEPCNEAFTALARGRTFAQVWADPGIWISYDPKNNGRDYGATRGAREITITKYSLRMGRWTTAATLVHELAHTNGAPGTDRQAEATLSKCLLHALENPNIIGTITHASRGQRIV